jgi:hypothetical protein
MMNTRLSIAILGTALVLQCTSAIADEKIILGAKLLGAGWQGDNGSVGNTFQSTEGGQFGFNIAYKLDRFYTGLNLQTGEYKFDSGSPDQFTTTGRIAATTATIRQNDFDLLAGYYFWPQVSLFVDLKAVGNVWQNNNYEQNFTGLGLGVSAFNPINQDWTLYGSFGFIRNGEIRDKDKNKVGDGNSHAFELGAVFTLDETNNLNMGIKLRKYQFEHVNNTTQDYSVNALFVGFTHSFELK